MVSAGSVMAIGLEKKSEQCSKSNQVCYIQFPTNKLEKAMTASLYLQAMG